MCLALLVLGVGMMLVWERSYFVPNSYTLGVYQGARRLIVMYTTGVGRDHGVIEGFRGWKMASVGSVGSYSCRSVEEGSSHCFGYMDDVDLHCVPC